MLDAKLRVTVRIGTTMGTSEDVGRSILSDTEYRFKSCPDYKDNGLSNQCDVDNHGWIKSSAPSAWAQRKL